MISELAKQWVAFVASIVKCMPARNANQWYAVGSTYLDKEAFDRINTNDDDDVVHGVQVVYGPFESCSASEDFIAEYAGSEYLWPGHAEWKIQTFGTPTILTPSTDPSKVKVIHNKSLDFQGQLELNEQQRRIEEIEKVKKRLRERENNPKPMSKEELDVRIRWLESDIERRRLEIEQEEAHLAKVRARRDETA